jgi:uncharacterized protein with HEPN domain
MPKHASSIPLRHMLDHAREAYELTINRWRGDLETDRILNLALTRLLETIGEAASRVPVEARIHYPGIPWAQIVGMRNRLIHGYDAVDSNILGRRLWKTCHRSLLG